MSPTRIVEALDKLEDGNARLGLRLKATLIEQLAFERGKEALRHRIVVGVSDRPHRGANTRLPTSFAQLDRGILRALIRMVDHAARPPLPERHVERSSTTCVCKVVAIDSPTIRRLMMRSGQNQSTEVADGGEALNQLPR